MRVLVSLCVHVPLVETLAFEIMRAVKIVAAVPVPGIVIVVGWNAVSVVFVG